MFSSLKSLKIKKKRFRAFSILQRSEMAYNQILDEKTVKDIQIDPQTTEIGPKKLNVLRVR